MTKGYIEGDSLVVTGYHPSKKDTKFPLAALKAISELQGGRHMLEHAMFFYNVISSNPEYRWVTPAEVEGEDLTGWSGYFYFANWEDSAWEYLSVIKKFENVRSDHYVVVDVSGEENNFTLSPNEEVLLVKLSEENFATESAEAWADHEDRLKWEAEELETSDQPGYEEGSLADWERSLLGLPPSDETPEVTAEEAAIQHARSLGYDGLEHEELIQDLYDYVRVRTAEGVVFTPESAWDSFISSELFKLHGHQLIIRK